MSIYRDSTDRVATAEGLHFEGSTGRVIFEDPPAGPVETVNAFLTGMHLQQFKHWTLRWLIFAGGLLSCACIATGFIFFVEKRKHVHAKQGRVGSAIVDALAVATVTGTVVAAMFMLVMNRVLPEDLAQRDLWERGSFWFARLATLAHGVWRAQAVLQARLSKAWAEQCWVIALLGVTAVVLNALTTGDHLGRTLGAGYWPVAGVDLMCWLALVMDVHWNQVIGASRSRRSILVLHSLGSASLLGALALCLMADTATMAVLVWMMLLAIGAVTIAFVLSSQPRLLAPLAGRGP